MFQLTPMKVSLNLLSSNSKTGQIPVSRTEEKSCPASCPLKGKGCYASLGHTAIHWRKVANAGMVWDEFCNKVENDIYPTQVWRHNEAGDLPHNNEVIDSDKVAKLVNANKGKRGFTYTHHLPSLGNNAETIANANANGFTVNLSADNETEADSFKSLAIGPVVCVVPETQVANFVTKGGNKVVICPAVTREGVTCKTCKLCANAKRSVIIGFPAHGVKKKSVSAMVSA